MKIVIKIGTSSLAYATGRLKIASFEKLCRIISDIKNEGHEVVIVSSGAIGIGVGKLNLDCKPNDIPSKQACASVGQVELMHNYDSNFKKYNHTVSQILLTNFAFDEQGHRQNVSNTINRLLQFNCIPIVNENDTISVDEIIIGDNDTLSAKVAQLIQADLLIILSDIDGLYNDDPRLNPQAELINEVSRIDENIVALAHGSKSNLGTGGMATKINAAKIVTSCGIDMIIINSNHLENLYKAVKKERVGTIFKGVNNGNN